MPREIAMSPQSREIIRRALNTSNLDFTELHNHNRSRFCIHLSDRLNGLNVFGNIPMNQTYVMQLIFENGDQDRALRDTIAQMLRHEFGSEYKEGGEEGKSYLTIYLPRDEFIDISESTFDLIRWRTLLEMQKVRGAFRKLELYE